MPSLLQTSSYPWMKTLYVKLVSNILASMKTLGSKFVSNMLVSMDEDTMCQACLKHLNIYEDKCHPAPGRDRTLPGQDLSPVSHPAPCGDRTSPLNLPGQDLSPVSHPAPCGDRTSPLYVIQHFAGTGLLPFTGFLFLGGVKCRPQETFLSQCHVGLGKVKSTDTQHHSLFFLEIVIRPTNKMWVIWTPSCW
ncbi:hypothetical protein RRG08_063813 [Elysia crispata]|uniref:Uncharacterized protein n=1 Tax=Elysia crispata TaxID=231223 RepID=A0AAE1DZM9_9GAST|nr:hypothetical protein RRG08_063813 [Elysia crispata]